MQNQQLPLQQNTLPDNINNRDKKNSKQQSSKKYSLSQKARSNNDIWLQQSSDEKLLICADPDSGHVYLLNPDNSQFQVLKNVSQQYRYTVKLTIRQMKSVINLNDGNWILSQKGEMYRRRKIPKYLLQSTQTQYPVYLSQSPISSAFEDQTKIHLKINLKQYKAQITQNPLDQPFETHLDIHAYLVTSADEVLKYILREIYKKYKVKLKTKSEEEDFILKISGFKEYLLGPHPLLEYDRVKISLRGYSYLGVILTEAELNIKQQENSFPPYIIRSEDDIIMDTNIDQMNQINWKLYEDVPVLLWYPPKKLKKYNYKDPKCFCQLNGEKPKLLNPDQGLERKPPINPDGTLLGQNKVVKRNYEQEYPDIPDIPITFSKKMNPRLRYKIGTERLQEEENYFKVITKQRIDKIVDKRRKLYEKNIFPIQDFTLLTGENQMPFRVKLKGVENLYRVMEQADANLPDEIRASYTGILPLKYIQKNAEFKISQLKGEKVKRPKLKEGNLQSVPKFVNKSEKKLAKAEIDPKDIFNSMLNSHGKYGSQILYKLKDTFDLDFVPYLISLRAKILFGCQIIGDVYETKKIPFSQKPRWDEWAEWKDLKYCDLPAESRIVVDIIIYSSTGLESQIIGHSSYELFDQKYEFKQGIRSMQVWPFYMSDDRLVCIEEYRGLIDKKQRIPDKEYYLNPQKREKFLSKQYTRIFIESEYFQEQMYWSLKCQKSCKQIHKHHKLHLEDNSLLTAIPNSSQIARLQELLEREPLDRNWNQEEKDTLFMCREHYKSLPEGLETFISSIKPTETIYHRELYKKLNEWSPPIAEQCLPLLDAPYGDDMIRYFATKRLYDLSNDEFQLFMIEFIQCLMFENSHSSPLCEMLLERSLLSPHLVGRELFWGLRSQLHLRACYERFGIILEQLIMLSGYYRKNLMDQVAVNDQIKIVAKEIKKMKGPKDTIMNMRKQEAASQLNKLGKTSFRDGIVFAIDNRFQGRKFIKEKIRVMNSKKLPLWMEMENEEKENDNVSLIFKDGDDIRQDQLTLQLIRIMDKIWLDSGYDFRMNIYKTISTEDQVGMIEIVTNSSTTADIHKNKGRGAITGAFENSTFYKFLKENNPTDEEYELCKENFLYSCAGYCVATYILGIGDRHSDNIMVSKSGYLFHIDFGHFLGNKKVKFGIRRERSPFVFTQEMCYVMGGKDSEKFKVFENLCCIAYNLIRKHGHFIINMFRLMLSAGIPELRNEQDIIYLVKILSLELSESQAASKFKREIKNTLNDTFKRFDNWIHEQVKK